MINLKSPFKTNNKSLSKRHSYLIWCIVALFFTLSITFKGICGSATKNNTITLPTSRDGIEKIEYMIDGMQDCRAVAFNAKGPMGDPTQLPIFMESIQYTVDHLPALQSIIVYTSSPNDEKILEIFSYAIEHKIEIQIPDNTLRVRNRIRGGKDNGINT